jgi:ribosomal protein L7Ae-like RNA K-turn-binding protein
MISDKLFGYLGFAAKARKLSAGYNTCLMLVEKKKIRLLIIAEDTAEGSIDKLTRKCRAAHTDYRIFGTREELSRITGRQGNSIYAVTDNNFARVIRDEIDRIQAEGEVLNDKKGI